MRNLDSELGFLASKLQTQQERNASFAALTDLADSALEHRTEVVSYRKLEHDELVKVAEEYHNLLNNVQDAMKGVSIAFYDEDSMLATAIGVLLELQCKVASQQSNKSEA
jgi:hypothetical protein